MIVIVYQSKPGSNAQAFMQSGSIGPFQNKTEAQQFLEAHSNFFCLVTSNIYDVGEDSNCQHPVRFNYSLTARSVIVLGAN